MLIRGMSVTTPARTALDPALPPRLTERSPASMHSRTLTELKMSDVELLIQRYRTSRRQASASRPEPRRPRLGVTARTWPLLIRAGPPRQIITRSVLDESGQTTARDSTWVGDVKIAAEYDGDHHRIDRWQFNRHRPYRDIDRDGLDLVVRVTSWILRAPSFTGSVDQLAEMNRRREISRLVASSFLGATRVTPRSPVSDQDGPGRGEHHRHGLGPLTSWPVQWRAPPSSAGRGSGSRASSLRNHGAGFEAGQLVCPCRWVPKPNAMWTVGFGRCGSSPGRRTPTRRKAKTPNNSIFSPGFELGAVELRRASGCGPCSSPARSQQHPRWHRAPSAWSTRPSH